MAKKKQMVQKELPLLKKIKDFRQASLIEDDSAYYFKIEDYIKDNLKHNLRPYQAEALYALNYTQTREEPHNQVLFNMATGSGKTDTMAGAILYLYNTHKYRNFIFVANTNAVVSKTK